MISIHITKFQSHSIILENVIKNILPDKINIYNLNYFIKYNVLRLKLDYDILLYNGKKYFILIK